MCHAVFVLLALAQFATAQDTPRLALTSLCDPAKIGQRQIDLANKLHAAGLLSDMERQRVISRQTPGFVESE